MSKRITLPPHREWRLAHSEDLQKSGLSKQDLDSLGVDFYATSDTSYCINYNMPSLVDDKPFYREKRLKGEPKYLSRSGAGQRAFIIDSVKEFYLNDKNVELILTEGEKKAVKAVLEGLNVIGLPGNFGYTHQSKDSERYELLEELKELIEGRREVWVIWDSDASEKWEQSFRLATERLSILCDELGASLYCIILPQSSDGKTGLDDYFCSGNSIKDLLLYIRENRKLITAYKSRLKRVPSWAKGWNYVASKDVFYHPSGSGDGKAIELTPQAFNRRFSGFCPTVTDQKGNERRVWASSWLLDTGRIERCMNLTYNPRMPSGPFKANKYIGYNTYQKPLHEFTSTEEIEEAGRFFEEFLDRLIGPEYSWIMKGFIAHNVQSPGVKIMWAIIFQGIHGIGKGILSGFIKKIMGPSNVKANINPNYFFDRFNDFILNCTFMIVEETPEGYREDKAFSQRLKTIITETETEISKRNTDIFTAPVYCNLIFNTNHKNPIQIEETERRWCYLESPISEAERNWLNKEGFYQVLLQKSMDTKFISSLYFYYLNCKIDERFSTSSAPKTTYTESMKLENKELELKLIEELIEEDWPYINKHFVISKEVQYALQEKGFYKKISPHKIKNILTNKGYEPHTTKLTNPDGKRVQVTYYLRKGDEYALAAFDKCDYSINRTVKSW